MPRLQETTSPADRIRNVFSSSTKLQPKDEPSLASIPASKENPIQRKKIPTDRPTTAASDKPSLDSISTIQSTPSTFVTPPTPSVPLLPSSIPDRITPVSLPSTFGGALSHRRTRSAATSNSVAGNTSNPPLTPHIEESRTPGGSLLSPSGSSNFFSSVFTSTQNAINQISNSLTLPAGVGQRGRSGTDPTGRIALDEEEGDNTKTKGGLDEKPLPDQEPTVATLGSGNLSLRHLGVYDHESPMASQTELINQSDRSSPTRRPARSDSQKEEASAAEAVAAAYNTNDRHVPVVTDPVAPSGRPQSVTSLVSRENGEGPASRPFTVDVDGSSVRRTASVRSKISGIKSRPHRGSTTGGAIAAALAASHGALANPAGSGRRPTGFAVASSKRNKDFHQAFRSVPEDDYLVEDYSAALQREILLQGRIYVSEKNICFSSNILGWVTNLVISFNEVVSIEKKSTAMIFPNAIVIQTLHAKHVFASFISRDPTYDLMIGIWKVGHPNLKSSVNGLVLDEAGTGDKTEVDESDGSEEASEVDSDDYYDDENNDDGERSELNSRPTSLIGSEHGQSLRQPSHKISPGNSALPVPTLATVNGTRETSPPAAGAGIDFPGPTAHAPTECTDKDTHYDKHVLDTTIPCPLGKVYSMMFGPQSGSVMRKFLADDQKSGDLQMIDDKKGMGEDIKSFSYSYIKPLNAPIGPKQTKCIVNQTLDAFDLEKAVSVTCSTQTPDVPSGSVFVTKTRFCLMWAPGNATRILMTCTVEWSGKSWIKGPIESGATAGQTQYGKDLGNFFRAQVVSKSPVKAGVKGKGGKTRRKKSSQDIDTGNSAISEKSSKSKPGMSWGPLEPLHDLISPFTDSLMTPVGILAILLVVMTTLWIRSSLKTPSSVSGKVNPLTGSQQLAAYEDLWRREESQLWDWLEDRINLDGMPSTPQISNSVKSRQKILKGDEMAMKLEAEKMSNRQVDDAIRVTEERLEALKAAVQKKKNTVGH